MMQQQVMASNTPQQIQTNAEQFNKKDLTVKTSNQKLKSPERKQSKASKEEAENDFPELPSATRKQKEGQTAEKNETENVQETASGTVKKKLNYHAKTWENPDKNQSPVNVEKTTQEVPETQPEAPKETTQQKVEEKPEPVVASPEKKATESNQVVEQAVEEKEVLNTRIEVDIKELANEDVKAREAEEERKRTESFKKIRDEADNEEIPPVS